MKRGVIIRPGFLWGRDNWMRVSTGLEQTEKFIKVLDGILSRLILKDEQWGRGFVH